MNLTIVEIAFAIDHHGMHSQKSLGRHPPHDAIKTTIILCHQEGIAILHPCIGRTEGSLYANGYASGERNQLSIFADGFYRSLFKFHGNILCRKGVTIGYSCSSGRRLLMTDIILTSRWNGP